MRREPVWIAGACGALLLVGACAGQAPWATGETAAAACGEACVMGIPCDEAGHHHWVEEVVEAARTTSAPAVVVDASGTHLFARGDGGTLFAVHRAPGEVSWGAPVDLGLQASSAPSVGNLDEEGGSDGWWMVFCADAEGLRGGA